MPQTPETPLMKHKHISNVWGLRGIRGFLPYPISDPLSRGMTYRNEYVPGNKPNKPPEPNNEDYML